MLRDTFTYFYIPQIWGQIKSLRYETKNVYETAFFIYELFNSFSLGGDNSFVCTRFPFLLFSKVVNIMTQSQKQYILIKKKV